MQVNEKAKPFIKWAGGKGQLLGQLDKYLPQRLYNEDFTYVEPFVGGGAMLFHILKNFPHLKAAIINDVNEDLVKAYKTIKDNPLKLIDGLKEKEMEYFSLSSDEDRKNMYLEERDNFNRHVVDDVTNTVLFMFLNKTCFNGLYRVNRKGEFNVPAGRYKNPIICNADTILADNALLNKVDIEITNGSFERTADFIKADGLTFFYFDPPYRPLDATSNFTSYSKGDFNDDDQRTLAAFGRQIDSPNCLWMLSNSDCSAKNPDDLFFEDLYNDFNIEKVWASRSINANPLKRGKLTELLIRNNYEINNRLLVEAV